MFQSVKSLFVGNVLDHPEALPIDGIGVCFDALVQIVAVVEFIVEPADIFGKAFLDLHIADSGEMRHKPVMSEFMRHDIFHALPRKPVQYIDIEQFRSFFLFFGNLAPQQIARYHLFQLGKVFEEPLFRHDIGLVAGFFVESLLIDQIKLNGMAGAEPEFVFQVVSYGLEMFSRGVFVVDRCLGTGWADYTSIVQFSAAGRNLARETAGLSETVRAGEERVVCCERSGGGTFPADRAFRQCGFITFLRTEDFVIGSQVTAFDPFGADRTFREGLFQTLVCAGA